MSKRQILYVISTILTVVLVLNFVQSPIALASNSDNINNDIEYIKANNETIMLNSNGCIEGIEIYAYDTHGNSKDITADASYRSLDESIATVYNGTVRGVNKGETSIGG